MSESVGLSRGFMNHGPTTNFCPQGLSEGFLAYKSTRQTVAASSAKAITVLNSGLNTPA